MLKLPSCFSGFVWEKGMLRHAVCAVRQVCSVNDGKGAMLGGRQCVDANRVPTERRKNGRCRSATPHRRLPSFLFVLALRREGQSLACTCCATARALHSKLFFCLHSFTHVAQTFVLHVIRGEDLCAKPSPPRQVDRVSGSSRAVIPFFLAAMPYFARVFEEKRAVFQSRPR